MKKKQSSRKEKSLGPSYETERKEKERKFTAAESAGRIRRSGTSAERAPTRDALPASERTTLNQSNVQEGPRGGRPREA